MKMICLEYLNRAESSSKTVFSVREIRFFLLDFGDLLGLLMLGELSAESTSELSSEEESSLGGLSVEGASSSSTLLLVKDGEVTSDILANSFDLGKLGSAS